VDKALPPERHTLPLPRVSSRKSIFFSVAFAAPNDRPQHRCEAKGWTIQCLTNGYSPFADLADHWAIWKRQQSFRTARQLWGEPAIRSARSREDNISKTTLHVSTISALEKKLNAGQPSSDRYGRLATGVNK